MKQVSRVIIFVLFISLLTACSPKIGKENLPDKDRAEQGVQKQTNFWDNYVETFEEYEFLGETDATFEDRHFALEDTPENSLEELVVNRYYYDISGEYEKHLNLVGDNKALKICIENEEEAFQEGNYMEEYIIHRLSTWSKADLKEMDAVFYEMVAENVGEYQLSEFAIVQADLSMVHSKKSLELGPQLGNGDYIRGFLCGKQNENDQWKMYEIYWLETWFDLKEG